MNQEEFQIQAALATYLRLQYPEVMFTSSLEGIKLPIGQAKKLKRIRDGRAWPDMFLAAPRKGMHGLFLELKRDKDEVYTQTGAVRESKHIREQAYMLGCLQSLGYLAVFACGFDHARAIIDDYLKG